MSLPKRGKTKRDKQTRGIKPDIQTLLTTTSHMILEQDNRVRCSKCHSNFLYTDPTLQHWLKRPCSGLGSACGEPVSIPYEELDIGNKDIYPFYSQVI